MAVITPIHGRPARLHERTGDQSSAPRPTWQDRLLGGILGFRRLLEVVAATERVAPPRQAEVARAGLLER